MKKVKGIIKFIGLTLILFALIANPFLVEKYFSPDQEFDFLMIYIVIFIFDITIFISGWYIFLKPSNVKEFVKNIFYTEVPLQNILSRFIAVTLYTTVMGTMWDMWWHLQVGRDDFWILPHILILVNVSGSILAGLYGFYITKERIWRNLTIFLIMPLAILPIDNLWHIIFEEEDLWIFWSPTHILIMTAIIISFIILLPILRKDKDVNAQRLFGSLAFAGILGYSLFLSIPIQPIGPYQLIGFWGAGFIAAILTSILLVAQQWIPGIARASLVVMSYLILMSVGFVEGMASSITLLHSPPPWLIVFSFLLPVVITDLMLHLHIWIRGALIGTIWSGIFYSYSFWFPFFEPSFRYSFWDYSLAIFASLLGGVISGIIISVFYRKGSTINYKKRKTKYIS